MLEKLFGRDPTRAVPTTSELELNAKWGTGFKYLLGNLSKNGGISANSENALLFDAVYSCINVLSDDIAKLPFKTYQRDKQGAIHQVKNNDVHRILRIRPNDFMTPYTFIKLMITQVCTHGNFYAYIRMNNQGDTDSLIPLTSSLTVPFIGEDGELYYQTMYQGKLVVLRSYEVIHIKGMSLDGIVGLSPIESVRVQLESIDQAGRYNKKMIEGGGAPQGVLTVTGQLGEEAKTKVRESWHRVNGGEHTAILDNGMDFKSIGISQADMQWLEAQKYNAQRVAAIFKVPLHKINDLANATYTNIEHQSLDYVKNTLQPWVTQIESEFTYKLYTTNEQIDGYYVKFNMDSELRGDSKARAEVNEINFRNGFTTIDEVRATNEMSPYDKDYSAEPFLLTNYAPAKNIQVYNQDHKSAVINGLKGGDTDNGEGHKNPD